MSIYHHRFRSASQQSYWLTLKGCVRAIRTVIWTPPHEERIIHRAVNNSLIGIPQPLNPSLQYEVSEIMALLSQHNLSLTIPRITARERLGLFAALMQFTMYIPTICPYFRAHYDDIERLYTAIVTQFDHTSLPLSLSRQYELAVSITHDALEAVWLLLVTSRQYARWYDGESFKGFTHPPHAEVVHDMTHWYSAVLAFKPPQARLAQDSAGDTYYVWTHVLAKLVFGPMAPRWAVDAWLYRAALHIGTWLNHTIAHRVSSQSVKSDHTIAAHYGNRIGNVIARALSNPKVSEP